MAARMLSNESSHRYTFSVSVMLVLVIVMMQAACTSSSGTSLSSLWGHKDAPPYPDRSAVSSQVQNNSMNGGEAEPTTQPTDPLTAQVQTFIAKFPPDDRDREAKLSPPAKTPAPKPVAPTATASTQPAASRDLAQSPAPRITAPPTVAAAAPTTLVAPTTHVQPAQPAITVATTLAMQPVQAKASRTMIPAPDLDVQASPASIGPPAPLPEPLPRLARAEIIDVRAAAPTTAPAALTSAEPAPPANQPVQKTAGSRTDLGALVTDLETAVGAHPEHLDDLFKLRLLYLATGQDDKAVGPVAGADPTQAEMVSALFQVVSASKSALRQPTSSPAPAILAIDELRRLLAQQSPVMIPKIALVTSVNSFGDYEAVNPPRFPAGSPMEVFLYTEVANFRSEPTTDGRLRTHMSEKVEIFDHTGKIVWQQWVGDIEDKVLTPRRDFFIPLRITLPATTPAGQYVLKVAIEDKIGATTDQQRMTFTVGQ